MAEKSRQTVIAEGTQFDGAMKSQCGVSLSGKLKGEITAPSLTIEESGSVDGRVEVSTLKSDGQVSGQIIAEDVRLAGRVGDKTTILASTLEVKLTDPKDGLQITFGDCDLQVGKSAAIDRAPKHERSTSNSSSKKGEPVAYDRGGL